MDSTYWQGLKLCLNSILNSNGLRRGPSFIKYVNHRARALLSRSSPPHEALPSRPPDSSVMAHGIVLSRVVRVCSHLKSVSVFQEQNLTALGQIGPDGREPCLTGRAQLDAIVRLALSLKEGRCPVATRRFPLVLFPIGRNKGGVGRSLPNVANL